VYNRGVTSHWIYRLYGHDRALLYLGYTGNLAARFYDHEANKPWWADVTEIATTRHADRSSALDVEREAILLEEPLHNTARYMTVGGVTKIRNFRVPDELWDEAKDVAAAEGRGVSEVVREVLEDYVKRNRKP
jgi:predicted GIY-YIG superfamily endonuclease